MQIGGWRLILDDKFCLPIRFLHSYGPKKVIDGRMFNVTEYGLHHLSISNLDIIMLLVPYKIE